jgi:predicted nucleic acid-binding protein
VIVLDTNILIDLFGTEDHAGAHWSRRTYDRLIDDETFGCNLIVFSELAAEGAAEAELLRLFDTFRVQLLELDVASAVAAGRAHRSYRERGGIRQTILADFLVAGHAQALGVPFMTRDRRLARYFPDLTLVTPETHP